MAKRKMMIDGIIIKLSKWLERRDIPPHHREFLDNLREELILGKAEVDDLIWDAELRGIRNPAFPGDLIGWLDDDFGLGIYGIEEDDDEDDDDTAKNQ